MSATNLYKLFAITIVYLSASSVYAETMDYLTSFKIPVQQTFCISKSPGGDIDLYKKCMLAIEKGAHKCDKDTKSAYEILISKYSNFEQGATEFMKDVRPITAKHFDCLDTLY